MWRQAIFLGLLVVVVVESFSYQDLKKISENEKKATFFDKMGTRFFVRERQIQTARFTLETKQAEQRSELLARHAAEWQELKKTQVGQRELFREVYNFRGKFSDELEENFDQENLPSMGSLLN